MSYQARTCFSPAVGEGDTSAQAIEEMLRVMVRPTYPMNMHFVVQILVGEGPMTSLKSTLVNVAVAVVEINGMLVLQWNQV